MLPRLFGKKVAPPLSNPLNFIVIPKGAAISSHDWSMGEALHLFCTYATEDALFTESDLPSNSVAVFRAYEFANELSNWTIIGWLGSTSGTRPVAQTVTGLRLIGADDEADVLEQAGLAWSAKTPRDEFGESADKFKLSPEQEGALVGRCSQWVRASPETIILGDGASDTVYKETMKRLHLCNPNYRSRAAVLNERRARAGLKPVERDGGTPQTLPQLVAEMQALFG